MGREVQGCTWANPRLLLIRASLKASHPAGYIGSLIRRISNPAPPSELPCGSLSRRTPAPRFPCGCSADWVLAPASALGFVYPSYPKL